MTALFLLPLLIGGYLAAVLVVRAVGRTAATSWRAAILIGCALVGAVLTNLIAGLSIGAYSNSHLAVARVHSDSGWRGAGCG